MVDDSCTIQKPTDTYVYQKTGAALSPYTPDDQLKECQLPVSVVKNISTEGLVQAWIDFPLVSQILTTNSVQKAVEIFKAKFNGLGELYNRYDGAAKLFDRYKLMKTDCSKTVSSAGKLANEFLYIEILLAQDSLITKMSDVQKKELVRESVSKYRSKLLNTDFGAFDQTSCLYISVHTLSCLKYQPFLNDLSSSFYMQAFLATELVPIDTVARKQLFQTILDHSEALK